MKRFTLLALTATATAAVLLAPAPAAADAPPPVGVSQATADAACAAVVGETAPTAAQLDTFRAARHTADTTGGDPAATRLSAAFEHLVYTQELHRDYLGLAGLSQDATFTCTGAVAVLPPLVLAPEVTAAACANPQLYLTSPALHDDITAALTAMGRSFDLARDACPATDTPATPDAPATNTATAPPTTTTPAATTPATPTVIPTTPAVAAPGLALAPAVAFPVGAPDAGAE